MDIRRLFQIFPIRDKLFSLLFPSEVIDISNAILYKLTSNDKRKYLEYTLYESGIRVSIVHKATKQGPYTKCKDVYFGKKESNIKMQKQILNFLLSSPICKDEAGSISLTSTYVLQSQSSVSTLKISIDKQYVMILDENYSTIGTCVLYRLDLYYRNNKTERDIRQNKEWDFDYYFNNSEIVDILESEMYKTLSNIYNQYLDINLNY